MAVPTDLARLASAGWCRVAPPTDDPFGRRAPDRLASVAAHFDDLRPDRYMPDGGRSRRRRHAVFEVVAGVVTRLAHRPHFQHRQHNPLFGGVPRWFAPIDPTLDVEPVLVDVLRRGAAIFVPGGRAVAEVHLFRVLAEPGHPGEPTPEGVHRDGVDGVCVMLVDRRHVVGGCSTITDADGHVLARVSLSEPGDTLWLDDHRVRHGTDPIVASRPDGPGHRDVLVATFRAG